MGNSDSKDKKDIPSNVKGALNAHSQHKTHKLHRPSCPPQNSQRNVSQIHRPKPFLTEEEFCSTWFTWKELFLSYMKLIDPEKRQLSQWGMFLLNYMGPVGQKISMTFSFKHPSEKENINALCTNFDLYYIFGSRKKQLNEDAFLYIESLKEMAKAKTIETIEISVKLKIASELDEECFTKAAKTKVQNFKFSSLENLTLREIACIWNSYTKLNISNSGHNATQSNIIKDCKRCGGDHISGSCPARGKQCNKCHEWNHFANVCSVTFITDCNFCGENHREKKCPAYGEICTKCKRPNHFSWKCTARMILNCQFCGFSHIAFRGECYAANTKCTTCGRVGHFPSKCHRNRAR